MNTWKVLSRRYRLYKSEILQMRTFHTLKDKEMDEKRVYCLWLG